MTKQQMKYISDPFKYANLFLNYIHNRCNYNKDEVNQILTDMKHYKICKNYFWNWE